jgi:hypothetical protein
MTATNSEKLQWLEDLLTHFLRTGQRYWFDQYFFADDGDYQATLIEAEHRLCPGFDRGY